MNAWEKRKFGELYSKTSEKNDGSFGPDKIISVATMSWKTNVRISNEGYLATYNVLRKGDIAFEGNRSKKFSFGRFVENDIGDGIVSHVFVVFRPKVPPVISYWKYFIHNEFVMRNILRKSTIKATMMTNLSSHDFLRQTLCTPSFKEQENIGNFLERLDSLIAATQDKLDSIEKIKKALLQHLFDQSMRFKGYSDPWEKRCLKEILSVNSGRDYKHLLPGKVPVYGTGGYMLSVNEALSHSDAIGIGRKGTIDRPFFLKAPFWTVDTLFFLTVKKEMVLSFVFPLLQTIRWKQLDESTGVPSLSKKTIESIMVHVPQKEEQQIIGNTFILIDNLIAATQSKLSSLETLKKALLQGLFI
ncbi:restriction endonuclease subunit S [Lacticaseibacillus rhamnosus]|uniref:restriction endonuclease subunit S n=1 Tax=Lacticaseibacillus rhamnosus TaxID=47715 RepID=UPI001CDAD297|nr:restriction endonuclease subunit S [Lacticaseibacillus rhamnosus]